MGYTFPQIDAMLLNDIWDVFDYWRKSPPVHVILRAVHLSHNDDETKARPTQTEINELARLGPAQSFDTLPLHMQQYLAGLKDKR